MLAFKSRVEGSIYPSQASIHRAPSEGMTFFGCAALAILMVMFMMTYRLKEKKTFALIKNIILYMNKNKIYKKAK